MNTAEKRKFKKDLYCDDHSELPVLSRAFKEIPTVLSMVWLLVVIEQLLMVTQTNGYSIVCLIIFIAFSSLAFPVLTYMSVYKILSVKYKVIIRREKIVSWIRMVSLVIFLSIIITLVLIRLDYDMTFACAISPALFIVMLFVSRILFYKEIRFLAYVRDLVIGGVFNGASNNAFLRSRDCDEDHGVNPINGIPMLNFSIDVLGNSRAVNDHDNEQV